MTAVRAEKGFCRCVKVLMKQLFSPKSKILILEERKKKPKDRTGQGRFFKNKEGSESKTGSVYSHHSSDKESVDHTLRKKELVGSCD